MILMIIMITMIIRIIMIIAIIMIIMIMILITTILTITIILIIILFLLLVVAAGIGMIRIVTACELIEVDKVPHKMCINVLPIVISVVCSLSSGVVITTKIKELMRSLYTIIVLINLSK